ncbi:hypothetical protein G7047_23755 [Diaphorobacter sp. HDW4A]|uniref:DUF6531 domain-containing protein n=1 Tax=Diaphorobacter sp. HDW4A TaxID=2714924 RepID=UPI001409D5D3|nr:DUF6531 domain-containing protein [Diaphorobacter sp. HDW4A]QIL82615.1 hypothetical protein G7047_23755 [Diaphorobacter sp. HDW4A]
MTKNPQAHIDAAIAKGGKSKESKETKEDATTVERHSPGQACSPRAVVPESGFGVFEATGALVLGGSVQTDFSLPGALPLVWQRRYSSYTDAAQGGVCGVLGHGWRTPLELRLEVKAQTCVLHDVDGRSIHFDALAAGESHYSASEDLWLLRSSGNPAQVSEWYASTEQRRFAHLPKEMVCRPHVVFTGHGNGDELWAFAPANRKALESGDEAAPGDEWQLLGRIDRLGRIQRYRYGMVSGAMRIVAMQDGVGRCYRLHYEQVRAPRPEPRYPSGHFWQADSGVRLTKVELLGTPEAFNVLDPELLVRYVYSAEGDLVEVRNAREESVQRYAWRNHLLTMHQERGGPEHHYRYERNEPGARVAEQRSQQGLTRHFSYQTLPADEDQLPRTKTVVTDSFKRSNGHLFKGAGGLARIAEHARADGSTVRWAHDAHGRLISFTDAQGRTTHLWPNAMGLTTFVQHPDGSETRNEWDAATGLLQSVSDPEGRSTRYHYDAWHRLERITRADDSVERRVYPEPSADRLIAHLPSQITDGAGGTTRFVHTREGLLERLSDATGNTTQFEHDAKGRLTAKINPLAEVERYEYDPRGLLVAVHLASGVSHHCTRDVCGRVEGESVSGNATSEAALRSAGDVQIEYDLWGRIMHREHAGTSMKWSYDDAGRLTTCTNENGDTLRLQWDEMDRLVHEIGFDLRTVEYRYGAGGRLLECIDGSVEDHDREARTIRHEWNVADRIAAIHHPANTDSAAFTTRFEWNRTGEMLAASSWIASTSSVSSKSAERLTSRIEWRRDPMGRVTEETQQLFDGDTGKPEFEYRISHVLDGQGRRIASELGDLGAVGFALNAAGALQILAWNRKPQIDFERDELQRETVRHLTTAGIHRQIDWNAAGLWQNVEWVGDALSPSTADVAASAIRARQYLYDHAGRMLAIHSDVGTSRFAYDAHGRLIASHTPQAGAQRWSFDASGNRLPQPSDVMTATHADDLEAESACADDDLVMQDAARRPESELAHTTRWAGGRVDYYTNAHDRRSEDARLCFCYDSRSNRTRVLDLHNGHAVRLHYDAANRLVAAKGMNALGEPFDQQYRHDALGRCVAIMRRDTNGKVIGAEYFGWDETRLVHIERHAERASEKSEALHVVHTVYEPGTLTPLVQLAKGQAMPVVVLAEKPVDIKPQAKDVSPRQDMREMLRHLEDLDARIKARLEADSGQCASHQAFLVRQVKAGQSALQRVDVDAEVEIDSSAEVQIRHVLNDHTGSPVALVDAKGAVLWALQQDPWGHDCAQHNPLRLWQPLRAMGRYLDESTALQIDGVGRGYDARLGAFINTGPRRLATDAMAPPFQPVGVARVRLS